METPTNRRVMMWPRKPFWGKGPSCVISIKHSQSHAEEDSWNKEPPSRNVLLTSKAEALCAFEVLVLAGVFVYVVMTPRPRGPRVLVPSCTNLTCYNLHRELHSVMDLSRDPCDDFYQYVCGRWGAVHSGYADQFQLLQVPIEGRRWRSPSSVPRSEKSSSKKKTSLSKHQQPLDSLISRGNQFLGRPEHQGWLLFLQDTHAAGRCTLSCGHVSVACSFQTFLTTLSKQRKRRRGRCVKKNGGDMTRGPLSTDIY